MDVPGVPGAAAPTASDNRRTSGTNSVAVAVNAISTLSGTWSGGHTITQCNGTGSAQDLICAAARGAFKIGSNLISSVTLTENGNVLTGTGNLAGTVGPVTGTVSNGVITLTGTLRNNEGFTAVISGWSTTTSGNDDRDGKLHADLLGPAG